MIKQSGILITEIFTASILLFAMPMPAQNKMAETKINPHARYIADMASAGVRTIDSGNHDSGKSLIRATEENVTTYTPMIIKLENSNSTLPDFVHEMFRRENLALIQIDEKRIPELSSYPQILRVEAHATSALTMDKAREFCNLPAITSTLINNTPLTARNVVTGFCDVGFDPMHINFLAPDGEPRVKKIVSYSLDDTKPAIADTPEEIKAWITDDKTMTHATHVAGIMAGCYDNGEGTYRGIATESDIVATTSPLYDAFLLAGCEQIINYAENVGKPAVINMSIASETGPHDGTTLFNQYMKLLADETPVCIAAGNSGERNCYLRHTISSTKPEVCLYPREWPTWSPLVANGMIDIWSADTTPLKVSIVGWDMNKNESAFLWETDIKSTEKEPYIICSPDIANQFPNHATTLLPERFSGYIYIISELNPENNRYNTSVIFNYKDKYAESQYDVAYQFGAKITGNHQQSFEAFASESLFFMAPADPLATNGDATRSISDLCTADGPISVGSITSRNTWQNISGETEQSQSLVTGTPSYFSSYGTLNNGTIHPDVCAPGAMIISSISSPYVNEHSGSEKYTCYSKTINGKTYYWDNDQGTSMATPYTSGIIALWLQANPYLTGKDVAYIIKNTATEPIKDIGNPRWGHGILDAEAGLKLAREMAGIELISVTPSQSTPSIKRTGNNNFTIHWNNENIESIKIYDISGRLITCETPTKSSNPHSLNISCAQCQNAVLIILITTESGFTHTCKLPII